MTVAAADAAVNLPRSAPLRWERLLDQRRIWYTALAAVLVAAAAARFWSLTGQGFNSDEAVYSGQAAALAGDHTSIDLFGVFRAHPLLVQFLVSIVDRVFGTGDAGPRAFSALVGIGLALVAMAIGKVVMGRVGALAMLSLVALSPYAVTVSRQMLLDGPMAVFSALTVLFLALYVKNGRRSTLYAAAAMGGLTFLSKETGILLLPAFVLFFLFARDQRIRVLDMIGCALTYAVTISPYPISLIFGGGGKVAQQFFVWQLFRRSNHSITFYLTDVVPHIGIPVVLLAAVGLVAALRRRTGMDWLMVTFTLVPIAFFEAWPVKGFQYLLPALVPMSMLAVRGIAVAGAWLAVRATPVAGLSRGAWRERLAIAVALLCLVPLGTGTLATLTSPATASAATAGVSDEVTEGPATGFLAGTGGLQGGREAGQWVLSHTLPDAHLLTIGPSFANVVQWYGKRRAVALSVSPNPLRRNPVYEPVTNPDALIRSGALQYVVYDSFSAERTPFFAKRLNDLVKKYHGVAVYSEYSGSGDSRHPLVIIYVVHP